MFEPIAGGDVVFHFYVAFLILSGVAMLVIAGVKSGQRKTRRIWNAIFGAVFTIYGLYLLLFFRGGHYFLFFYAFILPILMIVQFMRDRSAARGRQQATGFQGPPPGFNYGQPPGYGQPAGYGQPSGYDQAYRQPAGYDQPPGGQGQGPGQ
jgi:hypothetical protein